MTMNLTQKVICYQRGRWTLTALLQDIRILLTRWLIRDFHWSQEDADDFFFQIRPKVIRHIRRFHFENTSFSHYLRKMVSRQVYSYQSGILQNRKRSEHIAAHISRSYLPVVSGLHLQYETREGLWPESRTPDEEYFRKDISRHIEEDARDGTDDPEPRFMESEKRNLLIHSLKESIHWDDAVISRLSRETGISTTRILGYRQELFTCIEKKLERKNKLQDINTRKYLKLSFGPQDTALQEGRRERYHRSTQKLKRCSIKPTHRDIANCTGIPKGTVDSNLHKGLRRNLKGGH